MTKSVSRLKRNVLRQARQSAGSIHRRVYELRNTSCSDFELIVSDNGNIQHFWMTPDKVIQIPFGPLTPQVQEFQRRQMLSVTEVQI